jgi:hypothetical protein
MGISKLPIVRTLGSMALALFFGDSPYLFFGKYIVCAPFYIECNLASIQLITTPAEFRKGVPRIIDYLSSSGISNITKSIGTCTLAIMIGTSSHILCNMNSNGFINHLE